MRFGLPGVIVVFLLGCGSSPDNPLPDVATGVLDGTAFVAKGSLGFRPAVENCTQDGSTSPVLALVVHFDEALDSAYMQAHACTSKASSRAAELFIWTQVTKGFTFPGTYPRSDDAAGGQVVLWAKGDATCQQVADTIPSSSGSVVIETSDAAHIVGSLDVTFPGGNWLRGRFDAPVGTSQMNVCEMLGLPGGTPGPGCPSFTCIP